MRGEAISDRRLPCGGAEAPDVTAFFAQFSLELSHTSFLLTRFGQQPRVFHVSSIALEQFFGSHPSKGLVCGLETYYCLIVTLVWFRSGLGWRREIRHHSQSYQRGWSVDE